MIKNYLKALLLSAKRQKSIIFLNFSILVGSMVVMCILAGVTRIMIGTKALKVNKGELYVLEGRTMQGNNLYHIDLAIIDKINELNLPGTVCVKGIDSYFSKTKRGHKTTFVSVEITKPFSELLDIDFVDGNNFTDKHTSGGKRFAIIDQKIAKFYFGETNVVGREIDLLGTGNEKYQVIGVFKNMIQINEKAADVYIISDKITGIPELKLGRVLIRVDSKEKAVEIKQTLNKLATSLLKEGESFDLTLYDDKKPADLQAILAGAFLMIILALILPALLLSNLTIHRMESRLNELGVRRAFGASRRTIYFQLILENLVFTLLAGLVALFIGQFLLSSFTYEELSLDSLFEQNLPSSLYFLILVVFFFFGLITGIIPARKVSRQSIILSINSK